jgi:hypothetical protein
MIKLNINKLELPVLDVVLATPILIPLEKGRKLIFKIPSVKKYFIFEAKYLGLIATYFLLFSKVEFLELREFADMKLVEKMLKQLMVVMQNIKFRRKFVKILRKYFKSNFRITMNKINPMQLSYLFLFCHNIVENVKKNFLQVAKKMRGEMSETFSISSSDISTKIEPRF